MVFEEASISGGHFPPMMATSAVEVMKKAPHPVMDASVKRMSKVWSFDAADDDGDEELLLLLNSEEALLFVVVFGRSSKNDLDFPSHEFRAVTTDGGRVTAKSSPSLLSLAI